MDRKEDPLPGGVATCIFCKISSGEIPAEILYHDADIIAFRDIHPQAPLHALIVPRRHIERLNDAGDSDAALLGKLLVVAKRLAAGYGFSETGYRTVLNTNRDAGQEVFHLHVHLLAGRQFTWPPG